MTTLEGLSVDLSPVYDRNAFDHLHGLYPQQRELVDLVAELPPDSRAGLQIPESFQKGDPLYDFPPSDSEIERTYGQLRYLNLLSGHNVRVSFRDSGNVDYRTTDPVAFWLQDAAITAKNYGHDVVNLVDDDSFAEFTGLGAQAEAIRRYRDHEWFVIDGIHPGDLRLPVHAEEHQAELADLADREFRLRAEADYKDNVEKIRAVADRILEAKPDVAIVDERVVMLLAPDQDIPGTDGVSRHIEVEGRTIRLVGLVLPRPRIPGHNTGPMWVSWSDKVANFRKQQDLYNRQKNAATVGRILPNDTPSFIGTFGLDPRNSAAAGLFEIYQARKGLFSGLIEDRLGTARFEGEMDDDQIWFTKKYLEDPTDLLELDADSSPIIYEGTRQADGSYVGRWFIQNRSKTEGEFNLKPFAAQAA